MKSLSLLGISVALLATIWVGMVHGRLTNRWGVQPNAEHAAERLRVGLPAEVGSWRMRSEEPFDETVQKMLQCPAHIHRVYQHQQTGDFLNVAVIMGPPGPISVHTPEVCYSSRDFNKDGVRQLVSIEDQNARQHQLWQLDLTPNNLEVAPLRVFYGWSTGTTFTAPERPRFNFGGLPHLYKIQVAITDHPAADAQAFDAGKDFLECFLPQLAGRMVEATTPAANTKKDS